MYTFRPTVFAMASTRASIGVALLLTTALVATSCRATPQIIASAPESDHVNSREMASPAPTPDDNPFADPIAGGGIDFRLTRDDITCTKREVDVYADKPFLIAHVVVNGNLGAPCFGEPDERLTRAWQVLKTITPPGQLHDLGVFGGFVSDERDQTTLAFVTALDYDGSTFQMSVNLVEADLEPDELMLTMAHEFAHVATTRPGQIDWDVRPKHCETWHNLSGCYADDSLMAEWVELFWDDGRIEQVNPKQEPSRDGGHDRCVFDPSFLGPYSASHPEEDFAEAFSAFVFQVPVRSSELEEKMVWFASQPELAEFRNRAVEANLGPLRNYFERCG